MDASATPLKLPPVADAARAGEAEDWDWEAFRIGGQLYLYCYFRETVRIPLTAGPGP